MRGKKDDPLTNRPITASSYVFEGPTFASLRDASEVYNQEVYSSVHAKTEEWRIVDKSEAEAYLPSQKKGMGVTLGIDKHEELELPLLGSIKLDQYMTYKRGYIINAGGSIWGLDMVPKVSKNDSDPFSEYIAIAGYKGAEDEFVPLRTIQEPGTYKNCIQIWRLELSVNKSPKDAVLDLCLLHDYGIITHLKWCPYGVYEESLSGATEDNLPKLGILTFSCGDGSVRTVVVPHPKSVRSSMAHVDASSTVYMIIRSSRCTFPCRKAMRVDWGGHKRLAVGNVEGTLSVWNMEAALNSNQTLDGDGSKKFLTVAVQLFTSSIQLITWDRLSEPSKLIVGSLDGTIKMMDIHDPYYSPAINRIRNLQPVAAWIPDTLSVVSVEKDNTVKSYYYTTDFSFFGTAIAFCPGACNVLLTSLHHMYVAIASKTGWLALCNTELIRDRRLALFNNLIYKLDYHPDTDSYQYIDGIRLMGYEEFKELPTYESFLPPNMSIQALCWSPNKRSSAFLASGTASGLCRIEFVGSGKQWLDMDKC